MLFVTSFDRDLLKFSGKSLIESFLSIQRCGKLLCCYEGDALKIPKSPTDSRRVLGYALDQDRSLSLWDSRYREECSAKLDYWKKRAWQWYRKIPSLKQGLKLDARWLIWLDCDCEFLAHISSEFLETLASGHGVLYLKGGREWTETGIMIFDLEHPQTTPFLTRFFDWYDSGDFLTLPRWDDCWIFDATRKKFDDDLFFDLVPADTTQLAVVELSQVGKLLAHHKGSHIRAGVK